MSSYERIRKSEKYHTFDDIAQMQTKKKAAITTTAMSPNIFLKVFLLCNLAKKRENENNHFECV